MCDRGHLWNHQKHTYGDNSLKSISYNMKFWGKLGNTVLNIMTYFSPQNMLKWSNKMEMEQFGTNASFLFLIMFFAETSFMNCMWYHFINKGNNNQKMGTRVIKKYRDVFGTTKKFNFTRENKFLIEDFYLNKWFKGNK